jgi:hypothetical protein
MTITNAGLNLLRDSMKGTGSPIIKYVAFGSGTASPSASDTKLVTEFFRKAITGYANGASNGEIIVNAYVGAGDMVGANIQEIGFFAGPSATLSINSGILIARGLYSHNPKTNTESIPITLDLSL